MDSIDYLTKKIDDIEELLDECEKGIINNDDLIKKGWLLLQLRETHPLILAQYDFKKRQYQ